MSTLLTRHSAILMLVGGAFLCFAAGADAAVVGGQTITVKRFTGILSASGPDSQAPGQVLSPSADWLEFICDPRSVNWKIRLIHLGQFGPTFYIDEPRICDHVEILMLYYNPQISFPETGPVDGTAIYVRRIS